MANTDTYIDKFGETRMKVPMTDKQAVSHIREHLPFLSPSMCAFTSTMMFLTGAMSGEEADRFKEELKESRF